MLKDKMISDMIVHGYAQKTIRSYTLCMSRLVRYFQKSPLDLQPIDINNFFLNLRQSNKTALLLRQYLEMYNPKSYLFFSQKGKNNPISPRTIQAAFQKIRTLSKIQKYATVHTDIKSTMIYLHVSPDSLLQITSPLEKIGNIKLGVFENQHQYGFQFQSSSS
ncbi:site-specific integrase [Leptospira sp. 2 VSF19]|uniref:Site-specific integrase n=1 Tax=Leptospira soteropolitanensis TaxID=2950025 RepID=A0AAW5VH61_9LEPT|nr:phage integrase N-terminal SAM-like domain-containing protein [Leptospira soteropolitanensis]MCW7494614.1 site-specific integrase [Leptospira soteropolitanensis]MCW7502218.1 site-specific integrase [Leptospira soteropolitanensis]MCW7524460.1 site-specific integrase [Leptospira soteropolitanensis]MCW7528326.1 site-specific integrase [Leptospira soteropolitanensis]MCW7532179.1 site-specific integrase [Leptospira soteropolitanensis]